ncbi:PREDICTED: vesicle-associated membrane protein-associated protein B/C isoform X2 [Acromyrmex echinatior]|uniref:vesicle-associated membrane protein-associated protein B/C isoform X2 n=1 Tax=Acromyrmex echinatior TaxID=103372 RepID=UPI000580FB96|nr:PREDICTED: vesicle-associated membrane protein-associated protein B/C isoform X2 [Acromyrmex echinatior]
MSSRSDKPEQVLLIEPQNELRFRGPFTGGPVTSYIKLINPTNKKIYFKIKTTAPKRYCVRPNSGALKPKDVTEIAVCLQPYDFDPSEKNKHKFMVQTVVAPDDDDDEYPIDVWKDINPDQLMDSKLKCVFENPVINTTSSTVKMTATSTTTKADSNATNGKNKTVGDSVKSSPKEDLMKWRNAALGNDGNLAAARGLTSQSNSQLSPTSTSILIAFAMVIVGYLLGKLI